MSVPNKFLLWDILIMVVLVASMEEKKFKSPRHVMFMQTWAQGAQNALKECEHQFRWERWNCSISKTQFYNGLVDMKANREKAFLQGIFAASMMHVVTRQCSSGFYKSCSCAHLKKKPRDDWVWGGCSDNVKYGEIRTTMILNSMISGNDIHAAMNKQNNRAGSKAVSNTVENDCKCYGSTGSCTLKVCWKKMASMRKIGGYLKRKYKRAVRLDKINDELQNENNLRTHKKLPGLARNLVYLYSSPDYCTPNITLGVFGTIGRNCSKNPKKNKASSSERKSCRTLCTDCDYKVRTVTEVVPSSCNCSFYWCCGVRCSSCTVKVNTYYCNP